MRRFGSYALIATYLVVQLFGQVIHAWSGCEHAHLPGHFHAHGHSHAVAHADQTGADGHDHCHHHCHASSEEPTSPAPSDGWNAGSHATLAIDGCLLCQHLALGQVAPVEPATAAEPVAVDKIVPPCFRLATSKWLGPNSPRAPPVA